MDGLPGKTLSIAGFLMFGCVRVTEVSCDVVVLTFLWFDCLFVH